MLYTFQKSLLLWCCALGMSLLHAQPEQIHIAHGCNFDQRAEEREYFTNSASTEADQILRELCIALGIDRSSITLKSANVSNAVATKINGKRYILYSSEFIARAKHNAQSRRVVESILAHEIGHHILGHNFEVRDEGLRKLFELEADRFSGRILRNLCAEREEALLAINQVSGEAKAGYPILSARRDAISSGFVQQDQDLAMGERDPCVIPEIEPQFGRQFGKHNLARNVRGIIGKQKMRFKFDAEGKPGRYDYGTYLVVPPGSLLTPRTLRWVTPANSIGTQRELEWDFSKDGFTPDMVNSPDGLGIAVFEDRHKPEAVAPTGYLGPAGMLLAGGLAVAYGINDIQEADERYDNTYAVFRNPDDPAYQGSNPSRTEVFDQASEQLLRGQRARNLGYALLLGGTAYLIDRIVKHRRSRIGILYDGNIGLGYQLSPTNSNRKFYR